MLHASALGLTVFRFLGCPAGYSTTRERCCRVTARKSLRSVKTLAIPSTRVSIGRQRTTPCQRCPQALERKLGKFCGHDGARGKAIRAWESCFFMTCGPFPRRVLQTKQVWCLNFRHDPPGLSWEFGHFHAAMALPVAGSSCSTKLVRCMKDSVLVPLRGCDKAPCPRTAL